MTCSDQPLFKKSLITMAVILRLAALLGSSLFLGNGAIAQATKAAPSVVAPAAVKAVSVELAQSKVVINAKGVEQLVAASSVMPGDVIEYKVTYKNSSAKPVTGLVADLPIPEGLEYLPKSAKPGATLVTAATKDGVYSAEPLMRKLPDGKTALVPYVEYRALRWTLGQLPAGGQTAVTARAKVEAVVPSAPKTSATPPQAPTSVSARAAASASR